MSIEVTPVQELPKSRRDTKAPAWVEEVRALNGAWARVDGISVNRAQYWRKRAGLEIATRGGVVYARANGASGS